MRKTALQAPTQGTAAGESPLDSRLTRLDTLATVTVGLLATLLISHIALWVKLGEIGGQIARIAR